MSVNEIAQESSNYEKIPVVVERFKTQEKQQVVDFVLEVQKEFGVKIELDQQPDLQNIETSYDAFWVAKSGDKIIGTIGCIKLLNGDLVWKKWYVHKEFRKFGVGGKLVKELKSHAQKLGVYNIWIGSIKEKFGDAVKYYSKLGGHLVEKEEIDSMVNDYPHNSVDNIFFRLIINLNPRQRYSVMPTHQELQKSISTLESISPVETLKANYLRSKMLRLVKDMSVNNSYFISDKYRFTVPNLLRDVDNLEKLFELVFENEQIDSSQKLLGIGKNQVFLNIYLYGYSLESLQITKSQLQSNPIIFNRVWIQEVESLITKLENIINLY